MACVISSLNFGIDLLPKVPRPCCLRSLSKTQIGPSTLPSLRLPRTSLSPTGCKPGSLAGYKALHALAPSCLNGPVSGLSPQCHTAARSEKPPCILKPLCVAGVAVWSAFPSLLFAVVSCFQFCLGNPADNPISLKASPNLPFLTRLITHCSFLLWYLDEASTVTSSLLCDSDLFNHLITSWAPSSIHLGITRLDACSIIGTQQIMVEINLVGFLEPCS